MDLGTGRPFISIGPAFLAGTPGRIRGLWERRGDSAPGPIVTTLKHVTDDTPWGRLQ